MRPTRSPQEHSRRSLLETPPICFLAVTHEAMLSRPGFTHAITWMLLLCPYVILSIVVNTMLIKAEKKSCEPWHHGPSHRKGTTTTPPPATEHSSSWGQRAPSWWSRLHDGASFSPQLICNLQSHGRRCLTNCTQEQNELPIFHTPRDLLFLTWLTVTWTSPEFSRPSPFHESSSQALEGDVPSVPFPLLPLGSETHSGCQQRPASPSQHPTDLWPCRISFRSFSSSETSPLTQNSAKFLNNRKRLPQYGCNSLSKLLFSLTYPKPNSLELKSQI